MNDKMKNLWVRSVSGAVLVVVVLGAILWSKWSFAALLMAILLGGEWEFYRMAQKAGYAPQKVLGFVAGAIILIVAFILMWLLDDSTTVSSQYLIIAVGLALYIMMLIPVMFICELYRKSPTPIANIGSTLMGIVYVAMPLALLFFIPLLLGRGVWNPWALIFYIFIIWANDVCAYLVGMSIGKHRLFQRISPKKSWEGFFGGLAGAVATGLAAAYALDANYWVWGGLALVASLSGVAGDLVESMFKREAGVKDSGQVIPGHGGVLDRFDALLLSAPYVFLYLLLVGRFV